MRFSNEVLTRLITVATEARLFYHDFMASARQHVHEPTVLGWGCEMKRLENAHGHLVTSHRSNKLRWTLDWLKQHADEQTHILFVDAWDCMFQRPLRDIEEVYRSYGHRMLCSSDSLVWPLKPAQFPPVCPKYLGLNSGVWMSEVRHALEALERMLSEFKDEYDDDQGILQQAYVSGRYGIGIDHLNRLSHTVMPYPADPFQYVFDERHGIIRCEYTNTVPCVIHCNGLGSSIHKPRMEPCAVKLFTFMRSFLRPCSSKEEQALDKRQVAGASPASGTTFKVFGIGLSRTGTTSLTTALNLLDFPAVHFPRSHELITTHRAAADTPIAAGFMYLDAMYPGSKFILTVRNNMEEWLDSCEWLWKTHLQNQSLLQRRIHTALYDTVNFDREKFRAACLWHRAEVTRYFKGRESDLLVMDIVAGDGWSKLCPFLGVPVPEAGFPHVNQKS